MGQFHTDNPITGLPDSPDLLGREAFAEKIGQGLLLKKGAPGLVVSIEGEWGLGKTSFLNLINKYFESLPEEKHPITLNFCPWLVSGVENLAQEFLVQMATEIGMADHAENAQRAARQLLSYSKLFSAVKFIPGAEPWASLVQGVFESVGNASKSIGSLKELNIEERRNKVVDALNEVAQPIVVFIDDIDRIPPEEVYDTIRLVKSVADFPSVAFVLAFDPNYINESLVKYGIKNGNLYLDKIIQARINLPSASKKNIEKIIDEELRSLPEESTKKYFDGNENRLGNYYHFSIKYLLTSPRDVRRLFNRIKLIEPTIRGEVDFADLFALEVLGVKAPSIYEHIKENPGAYTGVTDIDGILLEKPSECVKKFSEERKAKIDALAVNQKPHVEKLIEELFPILTEFGTHNNQEYSRKRGWVAAADRLQAVHSYGLPVGEVSLSTSKAFITNSEKRQEILQSVLNEESFGSFVDGIKLAVESEKMNDSEGFIDLFSRAVESDFIYKLSLHDNIFFKVGLLRRSWWVLQEYFKRIDGDSRLKLMERLINDPSVLTLGSFCLSYNLRKAGFYGADRSLPESERWFSAEGLDHYRDQWLEKIKETFLSNSFCSLSGRSEILYLLFKIDPELFKELVIPVIEADPGLDCVIEALGSYGETSGKGRFVKLPQDFLSKIFDLDSLKEKITLRLKSETLDVHLRATYLAAQTGKQIYLTDLSSEDDEW